MSIVKHLVDAAKGKHPIRTRRSPKWHALEQAFLKDHPACEICGRTEHLQVHHKTPFHIDPSKELDPDNLIVLCEPPGRVFKCHLIFGHVGNFRLWNPQVAQDAVEWAAKLKAAIYRRKHGEVK